jgi:hypothetical protein
MGNNYKEPTYKILYKLIVLLYQNHKSKTKLDQDPKKWTLVVYAMSFQSFILKAILLATSVKNFI